MADSGFEKTGFIYAIRCGEWLVKVGRTHIIYDRLTAMTVDNPFEVILEDCLECPLDLAVTIETRLHRILKSDRKHVRGEWFSITTGTVLRLFDQMIDEFDGVKVAQHVIGERRGLKPGCDRYNSRLMRPTEKMETGVIGRERVVALRKQRRKEQAERYRLQNVEATEK